MTAKSSVNDMDISILIVRGFIKIISKWGSFDNFLSQIGESFISKWGHRQLFQSGANVISK